MAVSGIIVFCEELDEHSFVDIASRGKTSFEAWGVVDVVDRQLPRLNGAGVGFVANTDLQLVDFAGVGSFWSPTQLCFFGVKLKAIGNERHAP